MEKYVAITSSSNKIEDQQTAHVLNQLSALRYLLRQGISIVMTMQEGLI